jgi:hypothetical protein
MHVRLKQKWEGKRAMNADTSVLQFILPLVTASSAQPEPEAPPPIIRTSKLSV